MAQERIPKYRRHKASGQAVVTLAGRDHYLGPWKSKESRALYRRAVAEWLASGAPKAPVPSADELTVADVVAANLLHLEGKGAATYTRAAVSLACRPLIALYGKTPAAAFGPKALAAVRVEMANGGLSRWTINNRVQRIVRCFTTAASKELLPASVAQGLSTLEPLSRGELGVREGRKVGPIERAHVEAILPHVSREVACLIELMWWAGCRSGELVGLRPKDIDRSDKPWTVKLERHKTAHLGAERCRWLSESA